MKTICMCLVVGSIFLGGCSNSGPDLREGKWQTTVQVEMAGVPFKMPPMTYEDCLTQNDVIPRNEESDAHCKLDGPKIKGNTVSWASTCQNEDGTSSRSTGTVTYAGETFTGKIVVEISGDHPVTAENTLSGKYLGPCE